MLLYLEHLTDRDLAFLAEVGGERDQSSLRGDSDRIEALLHRPEVYTAFRRFHLENASVREISFELRSTEAQVGHFLQEARTSLRRFVTDEIREYVSDDAELAKELDTLFSAWR